ncbi:MAG: hypothetical protein ACI8TX_000231 [Hyphomicrobiaceae bacterium]|jgi:hypothetical protein
MISVGDKVVHQGSPGRFEVLSIEPTPGPPVYSDILTIRSVAGVELRVLDTAVRVVEGADALGGD